jgi:hypothetical protein
MLHLQNFGKSWNPLPDQIDNKESAMLIIEILNCRSVVFLYRFAAELVAECLTPPVTSILMEHGVWYPLLAAVFFDGIGFMLALALPETLPAATKRHAILPRILEVEPERQLPEEHTRETKSSSYFHQATAFFDFITRDAAVAALLVTFLVTKVGRRSGDLLLQYVSKRYQWNLSKASINLTIIHGYCI